MNGGELYRQAATLMPQAVRSVCDDAGVKLDELDLVIAHQANERIVEALRGALDLDVTVVPSNIAEYGNTTAATLPLLYHEMRRAGRVPAGGLVCFTAFGAGAHWGALLYREV
jgi:3-oxoacyl-[acyl-carrier-protein] synthase-3